METLMILSLSGWSWPLKTLVWTIHPFDIEELESFYFYRYFEVLEYEYETLTSWFMIMDL